MIQLSASRSCIAPGADEIARLQAEFGERHSIRLPRLLAPDLLALIEPRLARAAFHETTYAHVGRDLMMDDAIVIRALHFAVNDPAFLGLVEAIAHCGPLGCYLGRVYRMLPDSGHEEDWHGDAVETRQVGMSVNLSARRFEGGTFEIRTIGTPAVLASVHNVGPGDAVLFRIAHTLEHRVTAVTGAEPKTAFAGWFRTEPHYWDPVVGP